jgi:hypothetical protein
MPIGFDRMAAARVVSWRASREVSSVWAKMCSEQGETVLMILGLCMAASLMACFMASAGTFFSASAFFSTGSGSIETAGRSFSSMIRVEWLRRY